jgi:hypothetical protein
MGGSEINILTYSAGSRKKKIARGESTRQRQVHQHTRALVQSHHIAAREAAQL